MRSTRPAVVAGIQRVSSGTSVPVPRTWRTMGPRFTTSGQSVALSTEGAAGFSCETNTVTRRMTVSPATPYAARFIFFFLITESGRAISTMADSRTKARASRQVRG